MRAAYRLVVFAGFSLLSACAHATSGTVATPLAALETPNLDAETQAMIDRAKRVVFVVPFSHWDTDWHETFPAYVKRSDGNILAAIQMAQASPRFRYTLEQTLFVQHFWETYPERRAALKALVQNRQITFAWAGITQPETSLVAPAIQVRNLQLGQDWIAETFGETYVPRSAWQSDAFGNSAALPLFLSQSGIPYLFIGRWQGGCDPDYDSCTPFPHAFYWKTPASDARVLVAYVSYPNAWDAIHRLSAEDEQIAALRRFIEKQFKRTESRYIFLPMGSDFIDPLPNLPSLVDRWNGADKSTVLVMASPDTAFQYLATQNLPEVTTDFNPIWQAFYGSRPFAKMADKESDYYLTAADKFGLLIDAPPSAAWHDAAVNAHYDNIGAVSFDWVWESVQRPRFEQTLAAAADDLTSILARIASGVESPVVVFNPASWPRSEVVEIEGDLADVSHLPGPVQTLGSNHIAFRADSVPAIGFASPAGGRTAILRPATISQSDGLVTLTNGLVTASLDPARGGAFSSLSLAGGPNLLAGFGDDVTYLDDTGDIYGARFGDERARESQTPAQIAVLAEGPLIARAQAVFTLSGQPITKTITLRADSPLIEVALDIKALPETSAIVQTPTILLAKTRLDDLGFTAFEHPVDNRPIVSGDVTYRREIFYPIIYWSDIADAAGGLALITHGLQGLGGMGRLNLLLVRQVTGDQGEGVTDAEYHTLRYAYLPHGAGGRAAEDLSYAAYAFNQPLIPVWRSAAGDQIHVGLPFRPSPSAITHSSQQPAIKLFPESLGLLSAQSGLVVDLYRRGARAEAMILDYDPATPVTIRVGESQITLAGASPILAAVELP